MSKFIKAMFPLLLVGILMGCHSVKESSKEHVPSEDDVVIPVVEANAISEKTAEDVRAEEQATEGANINKEEKKSPSNYTYEDFTGAYALFEGEPYASKICYAFILTDTEYIDIVPEWMEYAVFPVNSAIIEQNVLQVSYRTEDQATESTALELAEENTSALLLNHEFRLYPVTREQLQEQNLSLPNTFFQ